MLEGAVVGSVYSFFGTRWTSIRCQKSFLVQPPLFPAPLLREREKRQELLPITLRDTVSRHRLASVFIDSD
jgi:hypothetical protein